MKNWFEHWYNKYAVMLLTAALCLGGYESVAWRCLTASDWGTWVGAVGTVFTLIGTIFLATAEGRRRKSHELDWAFVTVASLDSKVTKVHGVLGTVVEHFQDDFFQAHGIHYDIQANFLEGAGSWTDEEILPLIALPGHIAVKLAAVAPLLTDAIKTLREMEVIRNYSWAEETKAEREQKLIVVLLRCRNTLTLVLKEFARFTATRVAT